MTIKLLFSLPRSGTNLCAAILGIRTGEGGFNGTPATPKPMRCVLDRARNHNGLWTHYPYTDEMRDYLKDNDRFDVYANFRDPRDIIISYAWALEERPLWWWNYHHNGRQMADYPFAERIDYLIEYMRKELYRHDKWRTSGVCKPMRYSQNVLHPMAKKRNDIKRRGIVGSHKDRMTPKQIKRCNQVYGKLIELWS